jgi:hypothetical protein
MTSERRAESDKAHSDKLKRILGKADKVPVPLRADWYCHAKLYCRRALVGGAFVLAGGCAASAQPVTVVPSPLTLQAPFGSGGSLYEYNIGGGLLVQLTDGSGNVVSSTHPLPTSSSGGSGSSVSIVQTTPGTTNGVVTNSGSVTVASPPAGNSGTPTQTTGTCGTTSGTILAAASATTSETFHLASTAANPVWLNFAGATATQAAPNFDLQPGGSITFTASGGLLPTSAITCIASASTSVSEIFK